jgi:5-methylthioadenosine/S-adenosylhomocysteine deaminase
MIRSNLVVLPLLLAASLLTACVNMPVPVVTALATPTIGISPTAPVITRPRLLTPAMEVSNTSAWTPQSIVILRGRVVTMDDAGSVIEDGRVVIRNGIIESVLTAGDAMPTDLTKAPPIMIETRGVIYPGLIDLHNHPEYAIYPPMPIPRAYKDRYEWRNYDDDYTKRITYPNTVMTSDSYYGLGSEVGRYGEMQALVGGTTTLQGSRTFAAYSKNECLARNIENSAVTNQKAFSRVDIGRDAAEWAAMQNEKLKAVW